MIEGGPLVLDTQPLLCLARERGSERIVGSIAELFGARLVETNDVPAGLLVSLGAAASLPPSERARVRELNRSAPLFLFPEHGGQFDEAAIEAVAKLTGMRLEASPLCQV